MGRKSALQERQQSAIGSRGQANGNLMSLTNCTEPLQRLSSDVILGYVVFAAAPSKLEHKSDCGKNTYSWCSFSHIHMYKKKKYARFLSINHTLKRTF
jgi:hypothetical protein